MENSNSKKTNNEQEKPHPKPTDDVGATIETVTPDTEKEGLPNDQKGFPADAGEKAKVDDLPDKEEAEAEEPMDKKDTDFPDIETVTP